MKDLPTEIRLRNVEPEIFEILDKIAKEKNLATNTATLNFIIEQYHPAQKTIKDQKSEIERLQKELSNYKRREQTFKGNIEAYITTMQQQTNEAKALLKQFPKE